jgi:flagellar assembly factor FliW
MQQFETSHFGTIEYNPESVITFPKGIIQLDGFEQCTRYVLFHEEASSGVFHYLQSLDDAELSFTVVDPSLLSIDYEVTLSDEESALLKVEEGDEIDLLLMVYRPFVIDGEEVKQDADVKAQTKSPLIINTSKLIGFQKIGLSSRLVFTNVAEA